MARARNIKPGIMENEELAELDPFARLLFIYLWMLADCEGRLEDRPKRIKAQALPYDDVDVDALVNDLVSKQFISRYTVDGCGYIQITNFVKHQNVSKKEKESGSSIPEYSSESTGNKQHPVEYHTGIIPELNQNETSSTPVQLNTEYPILNTEKLYREAEASQDAEEPLTKNEKIAKEVVEYLNSKAKKNIQLISPNYKHITARLKDKERTNTLADFKAVIDLKLKDPYFIENRKYYHPNTLFNKENFYKYIDEVTPPPPQQPKKYRVITPEEEYELARASAASGI